MEPGTIGIRLASAAIGPLVKKLFVSEGAGAGVVDRPIRLSGHLSFTGEKRSLTESDLRTLAAKLVKQALRTGERPITEDEQQAVTDALAQTLRGLGDLTMTDLDAVRLGSAAFARRLRAVSGHPERELTAGATYFYERLVDAACLHILQFFTQRSTFVAHAMVEQTRGIAELTAKVDELIRRDPLPGAEDAAFEQLYLPYVEKKHGRLTIYGIDLTNSPARWPLDAAYLSLEATSLPSFQGQTASELRARLATVHSHAPAGRKALAEILGEYVPPSASAPAREALSWGPQRGGVQTLLQALLKVLVRSGVSCGALAAYLGRHSLQAITFASEATLSGLDCLRGQSALHTLDIDGCPDLTDLSAIGGLPIRRLNIATGRPDLDLRPVAQLGHLEVLTVDGPAGLSWSPRSLPPNAPLQGLLVRGATSPVHGLDGLGSLPALVRLVLNAESSPASAADWQEIRALHRLGSLRVSATSIGAMPAGMTLPGVNSLTLDGTCGEKVLRMVIRRLPLAFPGLGECRLPGRFTQEGDTGIDIGPLGGLPGLKEVQILASRDRVRGAELLPPSARVFFG
ncbi:hypothetical protein [Streptomyces sp. INR7]|uniref:NACHT N-terminal Helical domain 1-containing protein n=1 Tax=Streptomyces sp. INR7 TaxID=2607753 RepID=UPI0016235876|nr:hypothetical protein [Streptomyces sp. INR7]